MEDAWAANENVTTPDMSRCTSFVSLEEMATILLKVCGMTLATSSMSKWLAGSRFQLRLAQCWCIVWSAVISGWPLHFCEGLQHHPSLVCNVLKPSAGAMRSGSTQAHGEELHRAGKCMKSRLDAVLGSFELLWHGSQWWTVPSDTVFCRSCRSAADVARGPAHLQQMPGDYGNGCNK